MKNLTTVLLEMTQWQSDPLFIFIYYNSLVWPDHCTLASDVAIPSYILSFVFKLTLNVSIITYITHACIS